ncbi:conserved hypothetical protein [Pediculus humanus corporis]|uniref:Uncharacterized protein n=1 Tax=Pediculus humanus subsp. corporis TaxID=121224 RepID=E0VJK2_PEDHC|nr:uncharacterized protein Phum_PHUM247120 [Pediculus humanus corporis]EEB13558.1 conserved hypothetical protein [Pediculus humanus corporis]
MIRGRYLQFFFAVAAAVVVVVVVEEFHDRKKKKQQEIISNDYYFTLLKEDPITTQPTSGKSPPGTQEDDLDQPLGEFEVGGGSGDVGKEPAVMAQPQPSGTSTNPFVMPAPTANETTTLNFQDTTTYTPGTGEEK